MIMKYDEPAIRTSKCEICGVSMTMKGPGRFKKHCVECKPVFLKAYNRRMKREHRARQDSH